MGMEPDRLMNCRLCPRACGADRRRERGFCGGGTLARVALVSLHPWEEPCIAGEKGAGTVFFSGCNLRCCFCQNHEISHGNEGIEVTEERLAEIFLEQQERGAATLELVTPTHYVPQILASLSIAKERGFSIPMVYNTNSYETEETLDSIGEAVDIFLPDLKYMEDDAAIRYSAAPGYFSVASRAIRKMVEIAGTPVFDKKGLMKRGVIVRHLVLPGRRKESMAILDWLWENFGDGIYISLMSQYTPMHQAHKHKEINRRLTTFEYESVAEHGRAVGITQCYVQERSSASGDYVPVFDGSGVM